jgi:GGDEF domain-containing protein
METIKAAAAATIVQANADATAALSRAEHDEALRQATSKAKAEARTEATAVRKKRAELAEKKTNLFHTTTLTATIRAAQAEARAAHAEARAAQAEARAKQAEATAQPLLWPFVELVVKDHGGFLFRSRKEGSDIVKL